MKRNVITLLAAFLLGAAIPVQAVKYRGFVDFNLGGATSNLYLCNSSYDYNQNQSIYTIQGKHPLFINWGITTSHGLQLGGNFFIGLGIGLDFLKDVKEGDEFIAAQAGQSILFTQRANYLWGPQYFLHLRWDGFGLFGIHSPINPFVELKGGYLQNLSEPLFMYYDNISKEKYDLIQQNSVKGGFFIRPSIGIRLRLNDMLGLNLGLYCEPFYKLTHPAGEYSTYYFRDLKTEYETISMPTYEMKFFPFGINVGLDF